MLKFGEKVVRRIKGGAMKYRKWDSKMKAKIVLESLENKIPLA